MTRLVKSLSIEGRPTVALFDTGSVRSYVLREICESAPRIKVRVPYTVGLGGRMITISEECIVRGEIEGLELTMKAAPTDDIGMIEGRKLGAIIGATAMEEWEIRMDLAKGELDLAGLRKREFTEYQEEDLPGEQREVRPIRAPDRGEGIGTRIQQ